MNFHETPLILFTVLAQGAIGAFWWCFIALMFTGISMDKQSALRRSMLLLWVMMGAAFVLSTFHLGSPLRALNSLLKVGSAPLSNEIAAAAAFAGAGAITWLLGLRHGAATGAFKAFMVVTLVCSMFFLLAITAVYKIPTVPLWDTPLTFLGFFATTLIVGSAVAALLFAFAQSAQTPVLKGGPMLLASVGIFAGLAVAFALNADLQTAHFALKDAQELSEGVVFWSVLRFVLLFIGLVLWWIFCNQYTQKKQPNVGLALLFTVVLMLAEMVGRLVFYSLNMTVGLI